MGPGRRQANASTLSRTDLKFRVCGWSEDARGPTLRCILMDSVKATDKRFEVEVAVAPTDNFTRTLRVDALSLGEKTTTSSLLRACINLSDLFSDTSTF